MIPKRYIIEWTSVVPWQELRQVEQDLIITNALIKIYEEPLLREAIAFRGGTALNKLFFNPPLRYSEDIDLVQITAQPIGTTVDLLRKVMDPWLGVPKRIFSDGCVTLTYRTISDDGFPLKLKLEINTREHFSVLGFQDFSFSNNSSWNPGSAVIKTYAIEELLGTKLCALYQRRKGRDLFDLYIALTTLPDLKVDSILRCFKEYIGFANHCISKALFLENMQSKLKNKEFREDILPLLPHAKNHFDPDNAYLLVREQLIEKL